MLQPAREILLGFQGCGETFKDQLKELLSEPIKDPLKGSAKAPLAVFGGRQRFSVRALMIRIGFGGDITVQAELFVRVYCSGAEGLV